jgi:hypothetical protein
MFTYLQVHEYLQSTLKSNNPYSMILVCWKHRSLFPVIPIQIVLKNSHSKWVCHIFLNMPKKKITCLLDLNLKMQRNYTDTFHCLGNVSQSSNNIGTNIMKVIKTNFRVFPITLPLYCIHIQRNLYHSWIRRSISMVPERILLQLWLPHLLFSRIHCFFFRPLTKTMNRCFTVYLFHL